MFLIIVYILIFRPGQRQPAIARGRSQSRGRKPQVNKRINQGKPNNANISKANRSNGQKAANNAAVRGRSRVRSRGGPQSGGGIRSFYISINHFYEYSL